MTDKAPDCLTQFHENMAHIRAMNRARALRWHPNGIEEWSVSDWAVALAGEVGELCNVVKKLNRVRDAIIGNKETEGELRQALWDEMADVYLYLDLLAQRCGVDLPLAIRAKFNAVSVKHGFPERL